MARRYTIKELLAQLEASHVSYQKLEQQAAQLRSDLAAQQAGLSRPRFTPSEASAIAHDNYAAACIKAKELAMRTGRAVSVSRR